MPNGIEKSDDERYLYLNVYGSGGVRKIDVATGETVATADIDPVDNTTWGEDGRLLAAAHTGGMSEMLACQGLEEGSWRHARSRSWRSTPRTSHSRC